jgi:sigma-54 dependent transcriptional regulator, acetoin dehydrogenase operon transcriptional activator AcoR
VIDGDHPARQLQRFRDRILETGELPAVGLLRRSIANSWRRCILSGVSPEVLAPRREAAASPDGQLVRAARPVLEKCADQVSGSSMSLILGDRNGVVLDIWTDDDRLRLLLDGAHSSAGFILDESVAGTNGVGTVLEEQRPVQITAGEHFVNAFQPFTCAGVPIRHPITRQLRGVLNVSCRAEYANNLLLPFALQVARDVEGRLYLDSSRHERLLLEQFLSVDRRGNRPVVVLNDQVVIANPAAARSLDGVDQACLWEQAAHAVHSRERQDMELRLDSGDVLASTCRPVTDGHSVIGAVIEFDASPGPSATTRAATRSGRVDTSQLELRNLAGRSPAWREACQRALSYRDSLLPMLVTGEAGVGKLALVRAVLESAVPGGGVEVLDASLQPMESGSWLSAIAAAMRGDPKTVVLRHPHALEPAAAQAVCGLIDTAADGVRIVATSISGEKVYRPLLDRLSVVVVEVPPLRERLDDVPFLLAEFGRRYSADGTAPRWLPDAVQVLSRLEWSANVRQLENLARLMLATRRCGDIRATDLPEDVRGQAPRRPLSHLEGVELKEIMSALRRTRGNKTAAADLLGISRATLYRKVRSFGIDLDRTAF